MSAAKANLGTSEQLSEGDRKFIEQLAIYDQVMDCVLWLPEFDFSTACSCDQCRLKIARLNEFEKGRFRLRRAFLEYKYLSERSDKEDLCLDIATCVNWTKCLLDLLQKNLKAVCKEESQVPWKLQKCSFSRLVTLNKEITQKLRDLKVLPPVQHDYSQYSTPTVLDTLRYGYYEFGQTKAKNEALDIIKKIEKIENDHNMEKKIAEAQNMSIDPAVSKKYIEEQIEFVEDIPVDELLQEFNELIGNMSPGDCHTEVYDKTMNFISKTCSTMMDKSKKFWQGAPSLATVGSHHNSNGLHEILDSLLIEVERFEPKWKYEYATLLTPFDRSNPKRQATG